MRLLEAAKVWLSSQPLIEQGPSPAELESAGTSTVDGLKDERA
jgi:hypothetical protein